ncbi:MAG: hypothetical protein ABR608_01185 [Pseudonocardiaceae bacterium]
MIGLLGAGLLGSCGGEPEPSPSPSATGFAPAPPLPLPQPQPPTGPVHPEPGLDDEDRAQLAQARRIGAQWVVLLVAIAPERGAEATAQIEELGGVVGTSSPGPGYLRVTMPTVNVERTVGLPAVTAVDVDQVVDPHSPRPTG